MWRAVAALWFGALLIGTLYSSVRLTMPQITSQNYKDLQSGRLRVPPIVIILSTEHGPTMSKEAYLEAARQDAMGRELSHERGEALRDLAILGAMLTVSVTGLWVIGRRSVRVRSNNRWRGP